MKEFGGKEGWEKEEEETKAKEMGIKEEGSSSDRVVR